MEIKPKVTLLTHTPNPEQVIAGAAKLCYSPSTIADLQAKLTPEKALSFVEMLAEIGHESPLEHVTFTFGIEGVSRAFLAQVTRHRMASYSVQSQRYVTEKQFDYVLPPEIAEIPEAKAVFEAAMEEDQRHYDALRALLKEKHKAQFMAEGKEEKEADRLAEKKAIEDARFVLPNACDTKMVMTMNVRSLYNFFKHRLCNRAQWEIRFVAKEMLRQVCQVAPALFKKAGPPCVFGPCTEGKMSCEKPKEVREEFAKLKGEAQKGLEQA